MTNFKCIHCESTTGWRFLDCATCKMMEIDCTAKVCCDCGADTEYGELGKPVTYQTEGKR